jgi:hypothetical protein
MAAATDRPGLTTERFEKALAYGAQLHARQTRKGITIVLLSLMLAV